MSKTGKKRISKICSSMLSSMLFGTLSSGISNKPKRSGWESVYEAVNVVCSEKRTQAEVKKKWSNIKVNVKWRMAAHH